jgi:tetratricopeptide (TPR) repeat protein
MLHGDLVEGARVRLLLGFLEASQGNNEEAMHHLAAALTTFERYGHDRECMIACDNLADLLLRRAEHNQARAYLQRALSIAERIGDAPSLCVTVGNMGIAAARSGTLAEAEALLQQSIAVAERVEDPVYESLFCSALALVLFEQDKAQAALHTIRRALLVGRAVPACTGVAVVSLGWMGVFAVLLCHKQDRHVARRACQCRVCRAIVHASSTIMQRALSLPLEAEARLEGRLVLAHLTWMEGRSGDARRQVAQVLREAKVQAFYWLYALGLRLLACLLLEQGRGDRADRYWSEAHRFFTTAGMRLEDARLLFWYAHLRAPFASLLVKSWPTVRNSLLEARESVKACGAIREERYLADLIAQAALPC